MLENWPDVAICLLTFKRTEYALASINGFVDDVKYSGNFTWVVADDGSENDNFNILCNRLVELDQQIADKSFSERMGPGGCWNRAVDIALESHKYIFWLEDDWIPRYTFTIDPYVHLLEHQRKVGMVRLGHMAIDLKMESVGYNGIHYLNISKETQYCYSGNPSIRHRRYFTAYQGYPNDQRGPGDCEVYHDQHVRKVENGPQIWWPIDIGGWGAFSHIGTEQSY